jgi:hypothetical protein
VLWRIWQLLARHFVGDQVCETFSVVFRKPKLLAPFHVLPTRRNSSYQHVTGSQSDA